MKKFVESLLDASLASFSETPPAKLNNSRLANKKTRSSYLTSLIVLSSLKDGMLNNDNNHHQESLTDKILLKGNMAAIAA